METAFASWSSQGYIIIISLYLDWASRSALLEAGGTTECYYWTLTLLLIYRWHLYLRYKQMSEVSFEIKASISFAEKITDLVHNSGTT